MTLRQGLLAAVLALAMIDGLDGLGAAGVVGGRDAVKQACPGRNLVRPDRGAVGGRATLSGQWTLIRQVAAHR